MDNQDQRKIIHSLSGHENHGVHLCRKCGWPFPNPHPSARHRRAHKKICGTIEGFNLDASEGSTHLTLSDDEHLSDDDHKIPSAKSIERSISSVIGSWSNRSEDELFSDAVAEFSDSVSNPGIEEHLGHDVKSATNEVETVVENDFNSSLFVRDGAIFDTIQQPSQLVDIQMKSPELLERVTDQLGSKSQSQDHSVVTGSTIDSTMSCAPDSETKESSTVLDHDGNAITTATPSDASQQNQKTDTGDDLTDFPLKAIRQENNAKVNEHYDLHKNSPDISVLPSKNGGDISESVLQLVDTDEKTSDPLPASGVIQLTGEPSNEMGPKMSPIDVSPELESVEQINAYVETPQVKVNGEGTGYPSSGDSMEAGSDGRGEDNENVYVLSVNDVPAIQHPEVMIGEFKDPKRVKLNIPMTLDSYGMINDREENVKDTPVSEENSFSLQSRQLSDGTEISFKDNKGVKLHQPVKLESHGLIDGSEVVKDPPIQAVKDNLNLESVSTRPIIEEAPVEVYADVPQVKLTSNENQGSDILEDTTVVDIVKNHEVHSPREGDPQYTHNSVSTMNFPDNAAIAPKDAEVTKISSIVGTDNADSDKTRSKICDIAEKDSKKVAEEEKYTDNASGFQVDTKISLLEGDGSGDIEQRGIGNIDIARVESKEEPTKENLSIKIIEFPDTSSSAQESQAVLEDTNDGSVKKLPETEHANLDGSSDPTQVFIDKVSDVQEDKKELESNGITKTQECAGGVSLVAESHDGGDIESSESHKTSENQIVKVPLVSLLESPNHDSAVFIDKVSDVQEDKKELESYGITKTQECAGGVSLVAESHDGRDIESSESRNTLENQIVKVPLVSLLESPNHDSAAVDKNDSTVFGYESIQAEGDDNLVKQQQGASGIDGSIDSSSQTDSLEGHWGSVSVLSTQSDIPAIIDASNTKMPKTGEKHPNKSDVFEPPSFMTLVEPRGDADQKTDDSCDDKAVQNLPQSKTSPVQAAWFPSLTHVANNSQGRKKNEEIIAKVTNWSTGKQHTPLKSLLGEANAEQKMKILKPMENPNPMTEKDELETKDTGAMAKTVNSILGPESPTSEATKREIEKGWNSPARYPSEIKREKKVKGRPYWAQFMCCSSVN